MDATLKGTLALVTGGDIEARCAALLVLTRLRATDGRVVKAVIAASSEQNVVVRDFALGYIEATRPREALTSLLEMLDAPEDAVRARAVSILAGYGTSMIAALRKQLVDAPRRRLLAIISIAAKVRSTAAIDLLIDLSSTDDIDTNRAACDALIAQVPNLTSKERAELFDRTERLAKSARGHRSPLIAAAKLFGTLGDPKARTLLLPLLDAREPHAVRTHAASAMVTCLRGQTLTRTELSAVFPLFDSDDEMGFLRPAIRLLEDQQLDRAWLPRLNELSESPHPLVKRFAVQKLAGFDSSPIAKTLIGYLDDDSYARRQQSATSLKTMHAARTALFKELLDCDDERKAWTLSEILLAHDRGWKKTEIEALWKKLDQSLNRHEDRLFAAYFHFLHTFDAGDLAQRLRARAERLRKAKKFSDVARTLGLLKDTDEFDDETRYMLAIATLKAHSHTRVAEIRKHDPALELLRPLAATTFPLTERMKKDRILEPDDLYYVAFDFTESRGAEREAGMELLEHIADRLGRTKIGKMARNKLQLAQR